MTKLIAPSARAAVLPLLSLLLPAVLAGCASGLRSNVPPVVTYRLAPAVPAAGARIVDVTLRIDRAVAAPGYSSERVLVLAPNRRLDHYRGSRWPEALPDVVTALAVETLRSSKALSAVHDGRAPFTADYLLVIDIRRFDAEAAGGGPPQVRVVLDCTVGRRSDRGVVASFTAEGVATASETRMGAVVEAFEQAAGQALDSLSEQTLAALKADTTAS